MRDRRGSTHLLGGQIHLRREAGDDEAIAALASRQNGVVARAQLLDLGLSGRAVDHRLEVGRLRRLFAGTYAAGHDAISFTGRVLAAVIAMQPGAAASHLTAAALWGIVEPPKGWPHVTATQSRRPRGGVVIHRAGLPTEDVAIVAGIPVTGVARTPLDLSATLDAKALRRLVKQAEFLDLTTVDALVEILARYPRRRGRRALARLVGGLVLSDRRTRSELEDRFLEFCASRGLPLPETNVEVPVQGGRMEVDCLWREARLVVELDGRRAHATGLAFEDDRARDRALVAAGFSPVRVTWNHLHHEPDMLESEIRAALGYRRGITHAGGG
jgi:very-short-patch-repair endonuclease